MADSQCCLNNDSCTASGTLCAPPGASFGCGVCQSDPSTCMTDTDCKAQNPTAICMPRTCACDQQKDCVAGCTSDAGCGTGESCDLQTNRCGPTACTASTTCPQDFSCIANRCLRKGCISNDDCDAFCVEGQCYQKAGECRAPAA
jgi:hypothetical protein